MGLRGGMAESSTQNVTPLEASGEVGRLPVEEKASGTCNASKALKTPEPQGRHQPISAPNAGHALGEGTEAWDASTQTIDEKPRGDGGDPAEVSCVKFEASLNCQSSLSID